MTSGTIWVLLTALTWAAADALRKYLTTPMGPTSLAWWLSAGAFPLFAIWAMTSGTSVPTLSYWPLGALAVACNLAATLLMLRALATTDLAVAIPMLALTPVFSSVLAWLTLDQALAGAAWFGVALVVAGALILQLRGLEWRMSQGAMMMVVVAFLWSLSAVIDKLCLAHAAIPSHAAIQVGVSALAMGGWLVTRGEARRLLPPRGHRSAAVGAVFAFSGALGCQLVALTLTSIGLIETTKRAIGLTSAVVIGRWLFDEQITIQRIVGVVLMGLGATLVIGWT